MKEKFGNPPSKKPKEGRPPKPREDKILVCNVCGGRGFTVVEKKKPWDLIMEDCPVCEGTGEVYET